MTRGSEKKTHEKFLEKLKRKNPVAYHELEFLEEYDENKTKLLAKDRCGEVLCSVKGLLKGRMPIIQTAINKNDYFLNKLKEKNPRAYEELDFIGDYVNNHKKVLCSNKYGMVLCKPNTLLTGRMPSIESALDKHNYFLNMLKDKNPKAYNDLEFIEKYVNIDTKILAKDKYGEVLCLPDSLLQGSIPSIMSSTNKDKYFIAKAKEVHGDKYDYSKVKYKNTKTKICIICPIHSEFWQTPHSHLSGQGCRSCGIEKRSKEQTSTTEEFIKKAKEVHGDKYNYSKTIYETALKKVCIICSAHGEFWQTPNSHLLGCGCSFCARESGTYSKSSWIGTAKESKNFDSFKLYKIKCWNEEEDFYKIGITFRTVVDRFFGVNMPYNYKVVEVIESNDGGYIWDLENDLHEKHYQANLRYTPKIEFDGMTECFTKLLE